MARFDDKVILVSGGARGQGEAEARLFAREGARVVIGDIRDAEGRALAAEIGTTAVFHALDVTSEVSWCAAIDGIERAFGRLDVLVNNAGVFYRTPLETSSVADYMRICEINQLGTFLGMKCAVRLMKATGGAIVNISSVAGLRGASGYSAYVASKFAVRGMTKVAAIEFAPYNIRVNSVHPGIIDTAMIRDVQNATSVDAFVAGQLVSRAGTAEEVAEMVAYLASSQAAFVTGAEFVCDGGVMTGSRDRS
jgi:3alpha(or 20beta)-hydroxysteroid dehydrogenase